MRFMSMVKSSEPAEGPPPKASWKPLISSCKRPPRQVA